MSSATIFVGDELSAAGFRLCGVEAHVPSPGDEAGFLQKALQEGHIVLLGSRCAEAIPPAARLVRRPATSFEKRDVHGIAGGVPIC